jgi:hypothetical protein
MGPMKLIHVVRELQKLDGDATIYCVKPWSEDALAIVEQELAAGGLPTAAADADMAYFIEVFLARDFLADWAESLERSPTLAERCERLIRYATDDA